MKTALITGVSGQDGSFLSKLLLSKDYRVVGTSRDHNKINYRNLEILEIKNDIEYRSLAINDFKSVFEIISDICPDEIYNLAGQSSVGRSFEEPMETFESIATATLNLLESIKLIDKDIKLYNACSSECYGHTGNHVVSENDKFEPSSPYAVAKATSFWQVRNYRQSYNIFACSGLLFNHESHLRSDYFVTKKIIKSAYEISKGIKKELTLGNINISRDWGYAEEYVNAMYLMLQHEVPDDYIIATGETRSLRDFIEIAFNFFDLDYKKYLVIDKNLFRPSDIQINNANPAKANQILKWKSKFALEDIVSSMIKFEIENNK
ncbi:GDP-mannose 4,6-dehydratase [Candidatus Pseudothioglobus singularis]|jgi:GDPmannose 4,6-dehydratase|nr:GDP-mannose 4,6-dehydratase [Candidatus Pseudothioglobus singularis]